jgi:hypothetical protein
LSCRLCGIHIKSRYKGIHRLEEFWPQVEAALGDPAATNLAEAKRLCGLDLFSDPNIMALQTLGFTDCLFAHAIAFDIQANGELSVHRLALCHETLVALPFKVWFGSRADYDPLAVIKKFDVCDRLVLELRRVLQGDLLSQCQAEYRRFCLLETALRVFAPQAHKWYNILLRDWPSSKLSGLAHGSLGMLCFRELVKQVYKATYQMMGFGSFDGGLISSNLDCYFKDGFNQVFGDAQFKEDYLTVYWRRGHAGDRWEGLNQLLASQVHKHLDLAISAEPEDSPLLPEWNAAKEMTDRVVKCRYPSTLQFYHYR